MEMHILIETGTLNNMQNTYKGFALFNDIEDQELRNTNRAKVLANIFEDNSNNVKTNPKGAQLILGYFQTLPEYERADVQSKFVNQMAERGFRLTA